MQFLKAGILGCVAAEGRQLPSSIRIQPHIRVSSNMHAHESKHVDRLSSACFTGCGRGAIGDLPI